VKRCLSSSRPRKAPANPEDDFGAQRMLAERLLADFKPDAAFCLHVWAGLQVGQIDN
jgi:amidohydrolase